jgi:hypothetical protein
LPRVGLFVLRSLVAFITVAAIACVVYLAWDDIVRVPRSLFAEDPRSGSEFAELSLEPDESALDRDAVARYVLTEREIERLFDEMRENFQNHRDNLVRREVNRIALSNASEQVKLRASFLLDYLQEPDFTTFGDGFSYETVSSDPPLHDGTYVRWRGRIANLDVGEDVIRFDLLVGYETGQVLQGIVPVTLEFAVVLRNNDPVELIAQVVSTGGSIALRTTSIRVLPPGELSE